MHDVGFPSRNGEPGLHYPTPIAKRSQDGADPLNLLNLLSPQLEAAALLICCFPCLTS